MAVKVTDIFRLRPPHRVALCAAVIGLLLVRGSAAQEATSADTALRIWDRLLKTHVTEEGWVDYRGFAAASDSLQAVLQFTGATAIDSLSPGWALASLINAYNAYTVFSVLEFYPIRSVKDVSGFFKRRTHRVGGRMLSLDDIEKWARSFGDPRVHFVLNCASRSCPKLQRFAYRGDSLEVQIDRATREFLRDPDRGLRIDREARVIYLSRLFKWYGGDFAKEGGRANLIELAFGYLDADKGLNYLKRHYLTADEVEFIEKRRPKIVHMEYDWSLNEIPTSSSSTEVSRP